MILRKALKRGHVKASGVFSDSIYPPYYILIIL
jgi:hypothetical protein